ncbi:MAG: tetratricopeptide repeat protein [Endomicrobium sp.]|jgi:tetratricopeptide (TPR) repeat protein|nr:tetratricopeptide repeat protein [Endomicrobium sp.]
MRGVSQNTGKSGKIVNFVLNQIKNNRTGFFTVVGFVFGFLFLGLYVYSRTLSFAEDASDRLSAAYIHFGGGDMKKGEALLDETINVFPKTAAAYQARLVKADMLTDQGKYDEALGFLFEVSGNAKPETLKPFSAARIISVYEKQKDYENAIKYSNEFINKYKSNFLAKNIHLNLAGFYAAAGLADEAARVYNDILIGYPATEEAATAEKALKDLKK